MKTSWTPAPHVEIISVAVPLPHRVIRGDREQPRLCWRYGFRRAKGVRPQDCPAAAGGIRHRAIAYEANVGGTGDSAEPLRSGVVIRIRPFPGIPHERRLFEIDGGALYADFK